MIKLLLMAPLILTAISIPLRQAELNKLRELISRWRMELTEIWNDDERRNDVATQVAAWSKTTLERSGLLTAEDGSKP